MPTPNTRAELLDILTKTLQPEETVEVQDNYRYVIYARKSTDDKDKQARSLPDQIAECREFAEDNGFKLGKPDVIQEAESAKLADTRPRFREMLDAIKAGKYDGIIAWHPDRLARNMKDAGEIIDLLDKHTIKALHFKSFSFENNPSGKMLLGITFVLSKQYSDQLSVNVSRGNRRSVEEGKYVNRAKHGYYKDPEGYLRPDGNNFLLIKKTFRLRLEGKTLDEIAAYLNANGYQRWNRNGASTVYRWTKQTVAKRLMSDTIYCGVLVYGKYGGRVDLMEEYDFTPALTVPEFMQIHKLTNDSEFIKLARKYRKGEDVKANLLRGVVFCAECGEAMYTGVTTKPKTGKAYFYFTCGNEECERRPRQVRAHVILNYVRGFLESKPFSTPEAYEHFAQEMKQVTEEKLIQTRSLLLSLKTRKTRLEKKLLGIREALTDEKLSEAIKNDYRGDYQKDSKELATCKAQIEKQQETLESGTSVVMNYEKFLEQMDKMAQIMASKRTLREFDFIIRKLFSNFYLRGKNVENTTLSAPFDALYALKVNNSGHGETRTLNPFGIRF